MPRSDDDQRQDYDDRTGRSWNDAIPIVEPTPPVPPDPRSRRNRIGIIVAVAVLSIALIASVAIRINQASDRMKSSGSLLQIGLAIHNYDATYGEMPHNTFDPSGKPLLSWRVHILPFIEEDGLYKQFKLDEPWDSPNNIRLLNQMPVAYERPADRGGKRGSHTYYRGFSNPGSVFERRPCDARPRTTPPTVATFDFSMIMDGTPNTILIVEAGDPVEWTKPDDLDASPDKPFPRLSGVFGRNGKFLAVMCDTRVRSFPVDMDEAKLRALITHSGGETVSPD